MAKEELYIASLELMPIPTSAYLIAIRSLAPSPTMPTLKLQSPKNFYAPLRLAKTAWYIYLCFLTIKALFSGEIRAKTFTWSLRKSSGLALMKSLSMA